MDPSQIKKEDANNTFQSVCPSGTRPTLYGFPGKTKSTVWAHFGFYMGEDGQLDKSHAICRHCYTGVRYSGNTTNLHTHLARHGFGHKSQPRPLSESGGRTTPVLIPKFPSGPSDGENIVTSAQKDLFQPVISGVFGNTPRSPVVLHTMVAEYLIQRLEPPGAVENSAFVNMMSAAEPSFDQENCRQFCESFMSQHQEILVHSLSDILKNSEAVALTYERWTSATRESYITYKVDVINTWWDIETYTLATTLDCCSIKEDLEILRNRWDLQDPLTVISTGDVEQPEHSKLQIVHCLAEALNKAARAGLQLDSVKEVLANGQKIQQHLVREVVVEKSCSVVKDGREEWLYTHDILTKLLQHKEVIKLTKSIDDVDCHAFCGQLEGICSVLNPLKSAVDLMCSQAPIVASMILPIIKKLQVSLSPEPKDSDVVKVFKERIWTTLYSVYSDTEVRKFLLVASFLDPRYKDLLFVDKEERALAKEVLSEVATELYRRGADTSSGSDEIVITAAGNGSDCSVSIINNETDREPDPKKLRKDEEETEASTSSKSDDWLADVIGCKKTSSDSNKEEGVLAEVDQYSTMEQRTTSPFLWWSRRQSMFTTLSRVAKTYLCVPATSGPPDRMFEGARDRDDNQRRLLPADLVDKLIFLHDNYFKLK